MDSIRRVIPPAVALLALFAVSLSAEVAVSPLFSDHMVLQRELPIPIWGTAPDGEQVQVELAGSTARATAKDGKWKVVLPARKAGGPFTLIIRGKNTLVFKDVLLGDVWICGGQSNMQWAVGGQPDRESILAGATNGNMRLLKVQYAAADRPRETPIMDGRWAAGWQSLEGTHLSNLLYFSAVGYFFGKEIHESIGVPIGLIHANLGGTHAESWIPREAAENHPAFRAYLSNYGRAVDRYPQALSNYQRELIRWESNMAKAKERGRQGPRRPEEPMGPNHVKRPFGLYYGTISPLQPYGIKGVVWYQGENNANPVESATNYAAVFGELIRAWRRDWGQGDFPFLYVQLAAYQRMNPRPEDPNWAYLRESQARVLALPNTGMASAIDVGQEHDIHPTNKRPVGLRLAQWAKARVYNRYEVPTGPTFDEASFLGDKATVRFVNVGSGLEARAVRLDTHDLSAETLSGFTLCGENRRFVPATARITSPATVELSSPEVDHPVAVRYGWANFPLVNLYNREGFPANPFRSDDFPAGSLDRANGLAVGKPFKSTHPWSARDRSQYLGLTDGSLRDRPQDVYATDTSMKFPKGVRIDLQGRCRIDEVRVHNAAAQGTKTVVLSLSADLAGWLPVATNTFQNGSGATWVYTNRLLAAVRGVHLTFLDVWRPGFQGQTNGVCSLREVEVLGTRLP